METNTAKDASFPSSPIVIACPNGYVDEPTIRSMRGKSGISANDFSEVFTNERKRLVYRARRCKDGWISDEDVVQQAALELWDQNSQGSIQSKDHLRALLYKRVKSRAVDYRRRVWSERFESLRTHQGCDTSEDVSVSHPNLVVECEENFLLRHDVASAIAAMPTETQHVITACHIEGYTQLQVSRAYDLSRDQVARRLKLGKRQLCGRLSAYKGTRIKPKSTRTK